MYLAIKWLVVLTLAMWVALCILDYAISRLKAVPIADLRPNGSSVLFYDDNSDMVLRPHTRQLKPKNSETTGSSLLHYLTFVAGALVITLYNRRTEILVSARDLYFTLRVKARKISNKLSERKANLDLNILNETAARSWVAIQENSLKTWRIAKFIYTLIKSAQISKYLKLNSDDSKRQTEDDVQKRLLVKVKELSDERQTIGDLLLAAIQENKNIRVQYKLEVMAKSRLIRHLEEIQKQTKVCRSKYLSLKQLQMVTQEENAYLKARVEKIRAEKEAAVKKITTMLKALQNVSDHNIKAICSQIMLDTPEHLVNGNSDDSLQSLQSVASSSHQRQIPFEEPSTFESRVSDTSRDPYKSQEPVPKLRGLPGEYVFTIKDRNGMIEKLFQYDYGNKYDSGNTIQRIREYTVYHDKDCLLDFSNSNTIMREESTVSISNQTMDIVAEPHRAQFQTETHRMQAQPSVEIATKNVETVECAMQVRACCQIRTRELSTNQTPSQRFLTGSVAFQTFLRNTNFIPSVNYPMRRCINA